jgi:hypothetical protein
MSLDLIPELLNLLTNLQASIDGVRDELGTLSAELRAKPSAPAEPRQWYTVEEAASLLGKRPYTVREWCRHGQINAAKRTERRGKAALWSVSAEEIARYRDEGLLPLDPDRNNLN